MKNNKDKIVIGYCAANMFDPQYQDVDVEASLDMFEKILTDKLQDMYPSANVRFKRECPSITKFNGDARNIEVEIINREFGYVWGGNDWIVRTK
jgi:hypothetical protein